MSNEPVSVAGDGMTKPARSLFRSSGKMALGTIGSQAIMLAALPILTRLYGPSEFGVLAIYLSLVGLIAVGACLGLEAAIVLPDREQDARSLLGVCLLASATCAILTWIALQLVTRMKPDIFGSTTAGHLVWLVPLGVLLRGIYQALTFWGTRKRRFGTLATSKLSQAATCVGVQSAFPFTPFAALSLGLPAGHLAGTAIAVILLSWRHAGDLLKALGRSLRPRALAEAVTPHRNFPKYNLLASWLNVGGYELPPILLAAFFTVDAIGELSLAMRVIGVPTLILSASIAPVFYQRAAEVHRAEGHCRSASLPFVQFLFILGIPVFAALAFLVPAVFGWLFGAGWDTTATYVAILSPLCFFTLTISPITQIFHVYGKQRQLLYFQASFLASAVVSYAIAAAVDTIMTGVFMFALLGSMRYIAMTIYVFRLDGIRFSMLFQRA